MTTILRERPAAHRVLAAAIALVLAVGSLAALARGGDQPVGGAGRLETDGAATVVRVDGSTVSVNGSLDLRAGDVAEARQGTMTVRLADGARLEGRAASDRAEATKVRAGATPDLLGGELLVMSPRRTTVDAAGNHVTSVAGPDGPSATRVARSLAVWVGSYRGAATIDSAGQERNVPALREIEVAVLGRPPSAPKPLALDRPDGWDRRFLGEAIDLGQTLQAVANAYSPTLRSDEGRTAGFYRALLPALSELTGFDDALVRSSPTRSQGDILVGAAITALGTRGQLADRWRAVFSFRDDGARWGLVALDQGVAAGPLLQAVNAAVDRTPFQFAAAVPTPPTAPATVAPRLTTSDPTSSSTTTTSPGSQPTPTTAPSGATPPATAPDPTVPLPPPLPPATIPPVPSQPNGGGLVDAIGQLLGGLLGR